MKDEEIELDDAQLARAWELCMALVQNDASARRSLDVLFIMSARFVDRIDTGLEAGGVRLDSGRVGPEGKLMFTVRRKS